MDISEYTRIVLDKIQKFDPENATKIIGYLLLHDLGEQELAKLASCPDHMIREIAFKAKTELQNLAAKSAILSSSPPMNPQQVISHLPIISPRATAPPSFQVPPNFWEPQSANSINPEFMSMGYMDSIPELQKQTQLLCAETRMDPASSGSAGIANDYFSLDASNVNLNGKSGRRFGLSEFPVKTCHYFNKGYCKHGSSCRYYHGQVAPESFSHMNGNGDDQGGLPGSLAQLEAELVDLLRPRRGNPISIASLPMAYYEKYKKVLQADGYLTESQRHGKSGYSLTKLLARLKNSIRLIDRPHGQHAVVLVEDRYLEKGDPSQNISASRQIYLTFPADSTFTEQDVSDYFNSFGQVEDVRIPSQQRRMFGFVTFVDPETVKMILEKGNPHFVRGSRVLVKPYREKSKLIDRKYSERVEPPVVCSPHYVDMDFELSPMPSYGNPRFLRRQLIDEHEKVLEFQRRHLAQLQLTQKPLSSSPYFRCSLGQLNVSEDPFNFQAAESLDYALNDKSGHTDTSCADRDSQGIDLPESPFSFPVDSGISTVI
ncbi:zinc finger CCCH domain-containing protein 18-like isoform X2 [Prosopis cineraria]|uniref:zinc finger CCCH domain-containing protein 18-like isoform X2 n=1 Tax=Prosopis cineraria TaxID=364024 RepID=UPI00240EE738|nr:zinc finger CCCH domain-containing protein 18-like isoform X2 [Prosopis cineraria]XP_054791973.1 zinc finger CCCH domain-containing protein 18-like isoform X2 [Prosopis cineraria]XP_054791980.1 zinc finger CCCH domain-containing protein 18-like isoform X2 [Prosopis cineraria]